MVVLFPSGDLSDGKAKTGWDKVTLTDHSVTINQPGVLLDLSGLATGFLIDKAVRKMTSNSL